MSFDGFVSGFSLAWFGFSLLWFGFSLLWSGLLWPLSSFSKACKDFLLLSIFNFNSSISFSKASIFFFKSSIFSWIRFLFFSICSLFFLRFSIFSFAFSISLSRSLIIAFLFWIDASNCFIFSLFSAIFSSISCFWAFNFFNFKSLFSNKSKSPCFSFIDFLIWLNSLLVFSTSSLWLAISFSLLSRSVFSESRFFSSCGREFLILLISFSVLLISFSSASCFSIKLVISSTLFSAIVLFANSSCWSKISKADFAPLILLDKSLISLFKSAIFLISFSFSLFSSSICSNSLWIWPACFCFSAKDFLAPFIFLSKFRFSLVKFEDIFVCSCLFCLSVLTSAFKLLSWDSTSLISFSICAIIPSKSGWFLSIFCELLSFDASSKFFLASLALSKANCLFWRSASFSCTCLLFSSRILFILSISLLAFRIFSSLSLIFWELFFIVLSKGAISFSKLLSSSSFDFI